MSEKKRAGLSRLQNMSSYDDLVAMAAGDDKGNIAHFEQGFKDKAVELPLSQLHSFPNHPFKVNDDDSIREVVFNCLLLDDVEFTDGYIVAKLYSIYVTE